MTLQQPTKHTRQYSPNIKYTLTDDLPSSSDDDDTEIREYRNENNSSAVEGSVASRGSCQMPGDSFPTTAHQLHATSLGDDIEDGEVDIRDGSRVDFQDGMEEFLAKGSNEGNDTEQELLRRLSQGQARMEQIKRMLVKKGFYS